MVCKHAASFIFNNLGSDYTWRKRRKATVCVWGGVMEKGGEMESTEKVWGGVKRPGGRGNWNQKPVSAQEMSRVNTVARSRIRSSVSGGHCCS